MPEPIVTVSHLTYRYGPRTALDDLSLSVMPGEIFGLLGAERERQDDAVPCAVDADGGPAGVTVTMFGRDVATDTAEVRRRIGVVFQSPAIDKQLTAAENLRCQGQLYGLGGRDLDERNRHEPGPRRPDRPGGTSGRARSAAGMRRRVELAKGLLNQPDVPAAGRAEHGPGPRRPHRPVAGPDRRAVRPGVTVLVTTHPHGRGRPVRPAGRAGRGQAAGVRRAGGPEGPHRRGRDYRPQPRPPTPWRPA